MALLDASGISKSFGERTLFADVNFRIEPNDKIGFVGANGCGKTTLLKIITGELSPDDGYVTKRSGLRIGYLEQHACADSNLTAFEETLGIFAHLTELEKEIEKINISLNVSSDKTLIERQAMLSEKFISDGGLTFRSRAKSALMGLGFSEDELSLPVSALSGGQRAKIGLTKLLLSEPELILLDEPTNHLDISSIEWLEDFLMNFGGAALIISHDRYFLDKITSRTFEIKYQSLVCNNGNYSRHLEIEEERNLSVKRDYENKLKEIKRIEGIIEQQRTFSMERNYRTIDHKQKSIDRIKAELVAPETEQKSINFRFGLNSDSGNDVLKAEGLSKSFGDNVLYDGISLDIKRREHVFLLGANGTGKTTLLRQLLSDGDVRFGARVSVGYFDQLGANLDPEKTVLSEVRDAFPHLTETTLRSALAAFLFTGDDVFSIISSLSGGERARVSLCKLMLGGDNLLLLDEPTNHLDLRSREALENALCGYEGTIIAVSHDRYFINKLSTRILWLENGNLTNFDGNYDDFILSRVPAAETVTAPKKEMGAGGRDYHEKKQRQSELRRLRSSVKQLELQISENEKETEEINKKLSDPDVAADYEQTLELSNELSKLEALGISLYTEWENANTALEELEKEINI